MGFIPATFICTYVFIEKGHFQDTQVLEILRSVETLAPLLQTIRQLHLITQSCWAKISGLGNRIGQQTDSKVGEGHEPGHHFHDAHKTEMMERPKFSWLLTGFATFLENKRFKHVGLANLNQL